MNPQQRKAPMSTSSSTGPATRQVTALLVLGMHRAGTSALARVLSFRGAELPLNILPGNDGNPTGYWEPRSIVEFNDELLGYFGVDWDDPFASFQIPEADTIPARFHRRAQQLLRDEYGDADLFVLKDPRCTLFAEFWRTALEEFGATCCPVVIMRSPLEVADSLRRRDGMSVTSAVMIYTSYALRCIDFGSRHLTVFTTYPQLTHDWREACDRIGNEFGISWPKSGTASAAEIDAFLVPVRHSPPRFQVPEAALGPAEKLWGYLQERSSGGGLEGSSIEELQLELQRASELFSPLLADRKKKLTDNASSLQAAEGAASELHRLFDESQQVLATTSNERDVALVERNAMLLECGRLQEELDASQQVLAMTSSERDVALGERDAMLLECGRLQKELDASQQVLAMTSSERDVALGERDAMLLECGRLQEELNGATSECQRLLAVASAGQQAVSTIQAQRDEFEADRNRILSLFRDCESALGEAVSERDRLHQRWETREAEIAEIREADDHRMHLLSRDRDIERSESADAARELESQLAVASDARDELLRQHQRLCEMHEEALVKLDRALSRAALSAAESDNYRNALGEMLASRSWKLTAPLRKARELGGRALTGPLRALAPGARVLRLPAPVDTAETSDFSDLVRGEERSAAIPKRPHDALSEFLTAEFDSSAAADVIARINRYQLPVDTAEIRAAASTSCSEEDAIRLAQRIAIRAGNVQSDRSGLPDVSIIVPVYNQVIFTLACIDALLCHRSRYRLEVLVGDDGSTDATMAALNIPIAGVTHVRHSQNLGFVRNCNTTARQARGKYVVFLNNDTQVLPNWLDELIGTLEQDETIGMVGSKLVYPDGRMQECGAIVWKDGSAWNLGRFDDPRKPEYCYLRDVDYVSGASIALSTDLWKRLDGFDELFVPAYAEDADLAFRVRDAGFRTVVQPLSQLIHFEGISSGTDVTQGAKAYQVENLKKLHTRWRDVLQLHRDNAERPDLEKERLVKRRVLFVDHCTPTPNEDAGSLVAWEIMSAFRQHGYKVTFIPEDNFAHMGASTSEMQRLGVEAIYHPSYSFMPSFLAKRQDPFDVVFLHRYKVGEAHLHDMRKHFPGAKIIFLNADMHFLREMREAELSGDQQALSNALKTRSRELAVVSRVDCTLVHSDVELAILRAECPTARSELFPLVHDPVANPKPLAGREGVCFVGGYRHPPNADGIVWFVENVWPLVTSVLPDEKLYVAGSNVTPEVADLDRHPNVNVIGFVQNLEGFLAERRVSVAPLRYGAGAKGKVAVALANGIPSVCTPIAIEGMQLTNGLNVLVGETPQQIAEMLIKLLSDDSRWGEVALAGLEYARDVTAREHAVHRINMVLEQLGVTA